MNTEITLETVKNIDISTTCIVWLAVAGVMLLALVLTLVIGWRKYTGKEASFVYLAVGATGFFICVRVLELMVHMVCIVSNNPISRFITGHTVCYVIYGIVMAGVFEEVGRFVIFKYILKREHTKANAVMYGIGHGCCEVIMLTLIQLESLLAVAIVLKYMPFETACKILSINDQSIAMAYPQIQSIAMFGATDALMCLWERIAAVMLHIAMSVFVAYGVVNKKNYWTAIAVGTHMLFDTAPALTQRGEVSIIACELIITLLVVPAVVVACKLNFKKDTIAIEQ